MEPTSRSMDGLSSSRGISEPGNGARGMGNGNTKRTERRDSSTVLGKARRRWRWMQRPGESDAGGVADGKRLGETEDGEKKPVAAAVAARIAMVPSRRSLAPSLALLPVIRKGAEPKEAKARPSSPLMREWTVLDRYASWAPRSRGTRSIF